MIATWPTAADLLPSLLVYLYACGMIMTALFIRAADGEGFRGRELVVAVLAVVVWPVTVHLILVGIYLVIMEDRQKRRREEERARGRAEVEADAEERHLATTDQWDDGPTVDESEALTALQMPSALRSTCDCIGHTYVGDHRIFCACQADVELVGQTCEDCQGGVHVFLSDPHEEIT